MPLPLKDAAHAGYQGPAVLPSYDRTAVTPGIVHFGVGGFHRAHQAVYLDDLLNCGPAADWGICGIGVLDNDRRMRDVLAAQNGLYTVLEKAPDGTAQARVIGSHVRYVFAPEAPAEALRVLSAPQTRIVTLTITEGGYNREPATGAFLSTDPVILAEAAGQGPPRTHFRLLYDALVARRTAGIPPFTVLSCDNIQGNGHVARDTLMAYASLIDPGMADWIGANVRFPNSMVDRITPVTSDADCAEVRDTFGLDDAWPVVCESFSQWVVEDDFPTGRPPLEQVGVQMVADVAPYEKMKLRLLNASHQVIGYFAFLSGHDYVHDAMRDPAIRGLVETFMKHEAQPTLPDITGIDLDQYRATLIERFSNPTIKDTIARQCLQTSTTIPTFLLPVIRDQLASSGHITRASAVVAAWACYAEERGDYQITDRRREQLVLRARNTDNDFAFIEDEFLFGNLAHNDIFRKEYLRWRKTIQQHGVHAALAELNRQ